MNNKVVGGEIMKVPSSDNVNELLEMPVPNEKITEDVEDLVHDLESLLGKTSQSFDAQIRPKTADDSKSSSDEVTEKIKDDEGIKNNENIESNSSLDISSKETIENKDVNSEEGCNQLEIENKTTEISSQSPTFAKDEIGVEENLPICDNMNTTVDPTIDSKHSNEREPLVSEELSIDTENNSAVDNPLITIEVNKDIISDAKSNEINELTNDDSTSSWEIVDLNEAMALESSVSSTPSDNIEQPVNTIANSQNVLDDITSSGDKAGTSLLRMDTEENREADSIQVEATDQVDRKLDLITENIEKLEGASKVTGIGLVNKDTESDSSKVIISEDEDKCVNEVKGLDVTSCEAEAVPFEIEESDNATTSEKTKDVELQMEISSSEVSVQQEETQLQNTEDEPSNLEAVGSSENPKNLEDIVKLDKSDNLEISKEDLSCNAENSLTDDIAISKESVDVNHLDSAIPELTPENIQPDVEDGATSEVIVAKETDVTSHIVENIESVSETEEPNEKSNSDIVESVRESSEIKEVTAEDTESKIYDNTRQENENKSDIKLYESKGSEIISVEDLPELENTIGDTKPMDVEPDEKNLSENDQSEQESHSPDQTDSDITKAVEQTLNNPELESPQATKEAGSELLTPEEENTKSRTNEKVDEDVKIDTNTGEEVVMETEQVNVNEIQEIKTKEEETDDVVTEKVHIQADVEGAGGSSKETDNIKEDIKSDIKDICEAEEKTKQVESDLEETLEGRTDLVEPKEVLVELQEIKDDAEVTDDMKTDDVENDECKTCIKETDINLDIQQTDQVQSDVEMTELVKTDMEKNRQVEIGEGMSKTDVEETKDTQNITKTDKDDSELDQETCKVIEYIDEKGVVETEEPEITDSEKAAPINADQMDVEFVKVSTEESEQIETDDVVVLEPQTEQKLSDNVEAQASEVEDDTKSDIDISRSPTHQDLLEKNEDIEMSQASEIGMDNPEGDSALPIQSEKELNENISDDVEQIQSSGAIKDSSESDKDDSRLQTNEELSENIGDVQESPSSEVINDTTEADKDTSISHTEELPEKIEKVMEASPSSAFIQDATETDTDISRSQNEGDLTETIEDFEESQSKEVINDTTEADTNVSKSQTDELSNTNEEVMEGSISTALIQDATEADKETEDLSNSEKIDEEDVEKTQSSVIINDEIEKVETVLEDSQPHEAIGDTTEDVATNEVSEKVESVLEDSQPNEVIGDTTEAVSVYEPEKELSKEINNIKEPPQSSEITKDDTESVETSQEISSMQIDEVFDPVEVIQEESEACVEFGKNMDEPNLEANQDEEKMEVESDANSVSENVLEAEVEPKVSVDEEITVLESKSDISQESEAVEFSQVSDKSIGDKHEAEVYATVSEQVNKTTSEPVDKAIVESNETSDHTTDVSPESTEVSDKYEDSSEHVNKATPDEYVDKTIVESNENSDHTTDISPESTEVTDISVVDKHVEPTDAVASEQVNESDTEPDDNTESTEVLAASSNSPPCGIDIINVKAINKSNEDCDVLRSHVLPEGTDLIPVISEDTPTESAADSCQDHEKHHENKYDEGIDETKETVNSKIENKPKTVTTRKSLAELELAPLQLSEDDDSEEETVPRLALTPEESVINSPDTGEVLETLPQMEQMVEDDKHMIIQTVAPALVDTPDNLETILAVQSLQNIDIPKQDESNISEKERREMEALAMAVQSITEPSSNSYVDDYMTPTIESECLIQGDVIETQDQEISMLVTEMEPVQEPIIDTNSIQESTCEAEIKAVVDSEKVNEIDTQPMIQDNAVSSEPTEIETSNSTQQTEAANIEQDVVETSHSDVSIAKSSDIEPNITTSNIDATNDIDEDVKEVSTSEQLEVDPESSTSNQQSNAVTSFADTESEAVKKPVDNFEDSTEEPDLVTSVTDEVKTVEAVTTVDSVEDSVTEVSAIQEPEIDSAPDNTNVTIEAQESLVSEDSTTPEDPSANESEASTSEKVVCESVPETSFKEEEEKSTSVTTTDNKVEEFSVSGTQEHSQNEVLKHNKEKPKSSEKSKKHRKSERSDNFEELTINVDVSEKEKTYSPKVTIKPIKVPDEEVSTTTSITADSEISKGSLKMTITKQSDNTHSILKISDQEHSEAVLEPEEEPIPKLIIKPKIQQVEQQHSPKMSTRSSKQSPTSSNQSAISPRITIKPVVKQQEPPVSPLKIKINTKANTKVTAKDEESGRKTSIKSAAKSNEDAEPLQSPRITIKPIPKPDSEKETNPRLTIKPIKKSEEDVANEEKERTSPKITIKPIVKPQELESVPSQEEEEVKERIVLKINKGNLPLSPAKDPKKREHLTDEDKSERLAKITVKFSKEGGHHIVHQGDDNPLKRPQEELPVPEKNKKQKVDTDSVVSTRSTRNKEYHEGGEIKSNSATESKVSHRDQSLECPIEAKRSRKENINDKLKQKENDNAEIQIIESKVDSPITISEDSRSQDSGSVILLDDGKDDSISSIDAGKNVSLRGSLSVAKSNTPSPVLRKRGRPKRSLSPAGDQPKEVEPIAEKEAATQKKKLGRPRKTISPPKEKEPEPVAVEPATETDSATASPVPKKKMGRPRKVPLEPREDFKNPEDSPKLKEAEKPIESGRPKRSCRGGQSICDTLGIKPRKSRGSGRGRGSMRGAGNRSLTERDSFTGTLKEEEVSTSDKDKNPKSTENPSDKAGPSDKSKLGKAGGFTPTREVIVILDEAIPDKKSTVKETANIIRKSTEKSVQPDIIAIPDKKSMVKETANRIRKSTEKSVEPDIIAIPDKKSTVKETANRIRKSTEKSVEPDIAIPDKKSTVKETANRIRKSTEKSVEPDIAIPDKKSTVKETANIIRKSAEKSVEPDIIAIPDKKSTVKETANIIRKSAEKSVEPDIIEIESEDSQLSEKGSETTQNVKENQEDLKVTPEEPVQLMEVDSVETETSFEKKIPLHEEKSETDIKGSSTEKDEVETGKSVLDADGKSSPSILAPPATPKLFSQLGTSLPKSSNPEISSVSCSSTSIPSEVMIVDEETRMSAETNSRAQTPAKQVVTSSDIVEESQSSVHSTGTTESGKTPSRPSKAPRLEVQEPDTNVITADLLSEYYWKGNGPFMLQEQVAQFLGIKSFKRKYPGIMRRMLDMQERDYIREQGLASENMCDLGLTAVNAADILDIMYTDFQEKYEEYCKHQRDRQAKELINKQKALSLAAAQDKCKADITEQAVHSAAQWNARFNKTRKESRKTCMDLQNLTVHYPKGKMVPAIPAPHPGNYPVALVPGQFAEFYQEFTPTELNNLPINTMGYNEVTFIPREESDDSSSDGSESDSDSSGSSSSSSDSDSSSGVEDCKLCKHSPKKVTPATTTVVPSGTPATPVK
ncbi:titin isoform X1 [Diabrotica virgifera virgifera]|uniref:PHD finger protein 10 n=1 Tax=Diabrotica virgifera virgifera TaxID=50390 RepID=A0ABM5IIJ0_DIAVI|nr:titin isoform X1 [Diabrotica virgifera virgifera]